MIHDPEVEITCDSCSESIYATPEYKYRDWSGNTGFYALEDEDIEKVIESENDWHCEDGKHYCDDCWDEMCNPQDQDITDTFDEGDWCSDSDIGAK